MRRMQEALRRMTNAEISKFIDSYIRREDYRKILKDRMCNGYTYDQIAEIHGFSVKQIKNIVSKNENDLYKIMETKLH